MLNLHPYVNVIEHAPVLFLLDCTLTFQRLFFKMHRVQGRVPFDKNYKAIDLPANL
jgi:hypothetical protein